MKNNFRYITLVVLLFIITIFYSWLQFHIQVGTKSRKQDHYDETTNLKENYEITNQEITSQDKIYFSDKRKLKNNPNDFYLILEYTRIFRRTKFCQMKINSNDLKKYGKLNLYTEKNLETKENFDLLENCPFRNCFFTCDKSFADKSDAFLFHDTDSLDLNFERKSSHVFIFWNDEANLVSNHLDNLKFNWTISYKYESEASYCSYGCYKSNNNVKNRKQHYFETIIRKEFKTRANNSIWFISNCNAKYRIEFAANLGIQFPITVYGKCRNEIESKLNQIKSKIKFNDTNKCERDSDCEIDENQFNKFFLSLENSNCSSYITEKFWRSLHYGIIPVVIQPAKKFYEQIAPKNSYIHAEDFDFDISKLTTYLNAVSNNFTLYLKHLEWKYKYDTYYEAKQVEQNRICELCTKLNTYDKMQYYKSVSNYFNADCVKN